MGRTSKFSFPMPGRKNTPSKESLASKPPIGNSSGNLSKAQRILGTDSDLNIDSPVRDEHPWRHPGSRSSGMSISISESTQSTNEDSNHDPEQWDGESGIFPKSPRLGGKASSTLLGERFGETGTMTDSSVGGRLRSEGSSSTLRSYYDRQKSPLSISQQTSASSARDLALRKGFPPVVQRSPLLQVESSIDPFDAHFAEKSVRIKEHGYYSTIPLEKASRKKPARLDFSKLFPRSRKHGDKTSDSDSLNTSPSSILTSASRQSDRVIPEPTRRKLKKAPSKESIKSQKHSSHSAHSHEPRQRQTNDTLGQIYDHYEHLSVHSPHMDQIPEQRVADSPHSRIQKDSHHSKYGPIQKSGTSNTPYHFNLDKEPFSWKNVRSSMINPPWELSSAASISSRNTKTSRNTAGSVLSESNLKEKSVLSLSSDSEEDNSDHEHDGTHDDSSKHVHQAPEENKKTATRMNNEPRRQSSRQTSAVTTRGYAQRKSPGQDPSFLAVPKASTSNHRLSGPWSPPTTESSRSSHGHKEQRASGHREKRSSRQTVASVRSSQQPTPPVSPTSVEFRQTSERSSRFMAVTKQEEALLEALRQKRANMREKIIEEHETAKSPSPPRIPARNASRYSSTSSVNTVRASGVPSGKQRVLLYLDTPVAACEVIDTAEPSPDLSDFLSFGSDEDSTPRHSWAPRGDRPRPDSFIATNPRESKGSPMTPPSAARLSAVGIKDQGLVTKKRNTGVRFVDDSKAMNEFLYDENDSDVLWNV